MSNNTIMSTMKEPGANFCFRPECSFPQLIADGWVLSDGGEVVQACVANKSITHH